MAVAGSATSAYRVRFVGGELQVTATTSMSYLCRTPAQAMDSLRNGASAVIAGSDMPEFWRLWKEDAADDAL